MLFTASLHYFVTILVLYKPAYTKKQWNANFHKMRSQHDCKDNCSRCCSSPSLDSLGGWKLPLGPKPAAIEWCDGSEEENQRLIDLMIKNGTMIKLDEDKHPNSYPAFSDPTDAARRRSYLYLLKRRNRCRCDQ